MKSLNCRGLLGALLFAGMFFSFATASYAQSADGVGGTSFGNFGAGGAYGDFDLSSQAASYNAAPQAVAQSSGAAGNYGNVAYPTTGNGYGDSSRTGRQVASRAGMGALNLAPTGLSTLSNRGGRLPRTNLDSFVAQSGGMAELIYGDEGADGLPPYFQFSGIHRIERGIRGDLTTGHRSNLPEAWGFPQ